MADFAVRVDPTLGVDYLDGFLVQGGAQQKAISDTVEHDLKAGWHMTGSPSTWRTNDAMSYASQSTNVGTGEKIEFGGAIVYGCADNSGWEIVVPSDQTPPAIPKGSFPSQWTLVYEPTAHIWLIQERVPLAGQQGAPSC